MSSIYFVFAFLLLVHRSDASFPVAYHGYSPYLPYISAVAAPAPVVHVAPSFYPYPIAYHHPHRELHNVAGAIQREIELLTDFSPLSSKERAQKSLEELRI